MNKILVCDDQDCLHEANAGSKVGDHCTVCQQGTYIEVDAPPAITMDDDVEPAEPKLAPEPGPETVEEFERDTGSRRRFPLVPFVVAIAGAAALAIVLVIALSPTKGKTPAAAKPKTPATQVAPRTSAPEAKTPEAPADENTISLRLSPTGDTMWVAGTPYPESITCTQSGETLECMQFGVTFVANVTKEAFNAGAIVKLRPR